MLVVIPIIVLVSVSLPMAVMMARALTFGHPIELVDTAEGENPRLCSWGFSGVVTYSAGGSSPGSGSSSHHQPQGLKPRPQWPRRP